MGGFGGGGGTHGNCGGGAGGGGYSGGGGQGGAGSGGGSYNATIRQVNTAGVNAGHGQVTFAFNASAGPSAFAPTSPVFAASLNVNALWDRDLDGALDEADNCLEVANASQLDADGDGFGNACDADLNNDGSVGLDDVNMILGAMMAPLPAADLNGDGIVGLDDAAAALGQLGQAPGPGPETCGLANPCF